MFILIGLLFLIKPRAKQDEYFCWECSLVNRKCSPQKTFIHMQTYTTPNTSFEVQDSFLNRLFSREWWSALGARTLQSYPWFWHWTSFVILGESLCLSLSASAHPITVKWVTNHLTSQRHFVHLCFQHALKMSDKYFESMLNIVFFQCKIKFKINTYSL